jgi:hypothetical protein
MIRFFLPKVFCLSADRKISDHIPFFDVEEPEPEAEG